MLFNSFLRHEGGNFAMTLAIAAIPMCLTAGIAMDYSSASRHESRLQNAVDAATLAIGKDLAKLKDNQVRRQVLQFIQVNLDFEDFKLVRKSDINVKIDRSDMRLTVTALGKMPTNFGRIAGIKNMEYEVTASVQSAWGGIEAVLVLDNTGSMAANGKLESLKTAATTFVTDMMAMNSYQDRVKLGIVPFGQYVNVGLDNRNANWMSVPADSSKEVCGERRDVISKSGCVTKTGTGSNDGSPYTYQYEQCSSIQYGEPYQTCWQQEVKWNGCAGSRAHPRNLIDGQYGQRIPGAMNVSCPSRLTELTTNESSLKQQIQAMVPSGETYIPSGLIWGQRVISSINPFKQGVTAQNAEKNKITKAIVLMTDGQNTKSKDDNSEYHNWSNQDQADEWTTTLCTSIKDDEIKIYTVTFGTDVSDDTRTLLKNCASDPTHHFDAQDADDLNAAFADIAASLTKLYLTQ